MSANTSDTTRTVADASIDPTKDTLEEESQAPSESASDQVAALILAMKGGLPHNIKEVPVDIVRACQQAREEYETKIKKETEEQTKSTEESEGGPEKTSNGTSDRGQCPFLNGTFSSSGKCPFFAKMASNCPHPPHLTEHD